MKKWWIKLRALVLYNPAKVRIKSLEDQVAAQRQTLEALRYEKQRAEGRFMADYDALLDAHEQLQRTHRELERKYVAATQPKSADWMLAQKQGKAVRA